MSRNIKIGTNKGQTRKEIKNQRLKKNCLSLKNKNQNKKKEGHSKC